MSDPIDTHVADALGRVLEQYKRSPNQLAYISMTTQQVQDLEDALAGFELAASVAGAEGVQLDLIGERTGIARAPGQIDDTYRVFILAQIGINVSNGETERVIAVYNLLTQATRTELIEQYPASIALYSNGIIDDSLLADVALLIKRAMPIGVKLTDFGVTDDAVDYFSFSSVDENGTIGGGFGDDGNPATGGPLKAGFVP